MRGYALGGAIAVFAERLRKPPHPNPLPHLHGGEGALQLRLRANQELLSTKLLTNDHALHRMIVFPACGAIAQLGERYNGIVEVIGSIPISSTSPGNMLA